MATLALREHESQTGADGRPRDLWAHDIQSQALAGPAMEARHALPCQPAQEPDGHLHGTGTQLACPKLPVCSALSRARHCARPRCCRRSTWIGADATTRAPGCDLLDLRRAKDTRDLKEVARNNRMVRRHQDFLERQREKQPGHRLPSPRQWPRARALLGQPIETEAGTSSDKQQSSDV